MCLYQSPLAAQTKAFSLFHVKVNCGKIVFYPQAIFSMEWTAFVDEQMENIQILHCPRRVSPHQSECCSQCSEFSISCWLCQPPWPQCLIVLYLFFRGFTFLTGVSAQYSLQNSFGSLITLFGLSTILKIRAGEQAHYVGLAAASVWNWEKQMSVVLRKEFDMENICACHISFVHHGSLATE